MVMKNQRKQLLLLLSLGMSMHMITAMEGEREYAPVKNSAKNSASPSTIDVPDMMKKNNTGKYELNTATVSDLLQSHARATEQAISQKQNLDLSSLDEGVTLNSQQEAQFVTPTAFLTSILSESESYQEAFIKLNGTGNKKYTRSQQLLIQQARTLLVRAHPEVVPGLVKNLRLLPNRFVSYFKEKLPTLTTVAGKQRFTQSIVMEAVKSMPELPQDGKYTMAPNAHSWFSNNRFHDKARSLTEEENQQVFDPEFTEQLNKITAKYAESLDAVTSTDMFLRWSKEIITDIALLAPRAVGGAVGLGLGAARGAIGGTTAGLYYGGEIMSDNPNPGVVSNVVGGAIYAPYGLVTGTFNGAANGAVRGANIV